MKEPEVFDSKGETTGLVSREGRMAFIFKRDITNCLGKIVMNAVCMVRNVVLRKESRDMMEHLDKLSAMLANTYQESRYDVKAWIKGFREINQYLEDNPSAQTVYASLCMMIVQNCYAYMFTSTRVGVNSGDSFTDEEEGMLFLTTCASSTHRGEKHLRKYLKEVQPVCPEMSREMVKMLNGEWEEYLKKVEERQDGKGTENSG